MIPVMLGYAKGKVTLSLALLGGASHEEQGK